MQRSHFNGIEWHKRTQDTGQWSQTHGTEAKDRRQRRITQTHIMHMAHGNGHMPVGTLEELGAWSMLVVASINK